MAAPIAWHLVQSFSPHLWNGHVGQIQAMPFHRYLSRSLQVAAIVLLWPLMRSLHVRSLKEFGLFPNPRCMRDMTIGFSAGIFCALLMQPLLIFSGAFVLNADWSSHLLLALPRLLLTAAVVAILEEFLFRGVLLGFLRQVMDPMLAILISALIFAGVHFLNLPSSGSASLPPSWSSGLAMIASLGGALPPWQMLLAAFATLFVAGVIVAWMTVRTGSLWSAIGLHGSWVLSQQLFNTAAGFQVHPQNALLPFLGPSQCNGMVPVGLVPLLSLLLAGFLVTILLRKRTQPPIFPLSGR